jgi:hypothetical protein
MNKTKKVLEALMRDFAQGVGHEGLDYFRPEDPALLRIAQALCHRGCRSDLFCPDPGRQKKIKNNSDLRTHLNKLHDITGTCCKDLMRSFLEGVYPERMNIMLMIGDEDVADRQSDIDKYPCVGCDYFHERHHGVEVHAKNKHKKVHENIEAAGWFSCSIRTMITANAAITI